MILDNVKSLYAARLAVCELTGAGAAIPSSYEYHFKRNHLLPQCVQEANLDTRKASDAAYME